MKAMIIFLILISAGSLLGDDRYRELLVSILTDHKVNFQNACDKKNCTESFKIHMEKISWKLRQEYNGQFLNIPIPVQNGTNALGTSDVRLDKNGDEGGWNFEDDKIASLALIQNVIRLNINKCIMEKAPSTKQEKEQTLADCFAELNELIGKIVNE